MADAESTRKVTLTFSGEAFADGRVPLTLLAEKLKALERENRELRQANEILRKASAYFAQAELDRRVKP